MSGLLLRRTSTPGLLPPDGEPGQVWLNLADHTLGVMGNDGKPAVIISTKTGQIVLPPGQTVDSAASEFWQTVRFLATEKLPILPGHRNVAYRPAEKTDVLECPAPRNWFRRIFG